MPRQTTYDVRIWKTEKYVEECVTTHTVVWVGRAQEMERAATAPLPPRVSDPNCLRPRGRVHLADADVAPAQVAEWGGRSVAVVHAVYESCLDGQRERDLPRIHDLLTR